MLKTLNQIQQMYQGSVLQKTTRYAKETGAWYMNDYCAVGNVSCISQAVEHPTLLRRERLIEKGTAHEIQQ